MLGTLQREFRNGHATHLGDLFVVKKTREGQPQHDAIWQL
jgi:hypothetical protein